MMFYYPYLLMTEDNVIDSGNPSDALKFFKGFKNGRMRMSLINVLNNLSCRLI